MGKLPLKAVPLLVFSAISSSFALGETVNFEPAVYVSGLGIESIDSWLKYQTGTPGQETLISPFVVKEISGSKTLWCKADEKVQYGVMRAFEPFSGSDIVDLTWKWSAETDSVNFCVGVASQGKGILVPTPKAQVCISTGGTVSIPQEGGPKTVTGKWQIGKTYFTRIKADILKGSFSVYASSDLNKIEDTASLVFAGLSLQGTKAQQIHKAFLSATHGLTTAGVYVDDITFLGIRANIWTGSNTNGIGNNSWYAPANWSRNDVPDSNDIVLFSPNLTTYPLSNKQCNLNPLPSLTPPPARILAIGINKTYTGIINLNTDTLTVIYSADFSGGKYESAGGFVRFAYPSLQYLIDTGGTVLPPILQAGPGLLNLANNGQPMKFSSYRQTGGGLNLNKSDISVSGNFYVSGTPKSINPPFYNINGLYGLEGRMLLISGATQLIGSDADNKLALTVPSNNWKIQANGSVSASNVILRNAKVSSQTSATIIGNAISSVDSGNNPGWIFWSAPKTSKHPTDISALVGQKVKFKVVATPVDFTHPLQYQWQLGLGNGIYTKIINANFDSLEMDPLTKSDSGHSVRCYFSNPAGSDTSNPAKILVRFPAPTSNYPTGTFQDSIYVQLQDSVSTAAIFYSLNGDRPLIYNRTDSIKILATTTLQTFAVLGTDSSAKVTFTFNKVTTGAKTGIPIASPSGGSFPDTFSVSLTSATPGAVIYYTMDGTTPTRSSAIFSSNEPILVRTSPIPLRAFAVVPSLSPSEMMNETYTILTRDTLTVPTINPTTGTIFSDSLLLTLQTNHAAASIYYRLNNGSLTKYALPLYLKQTTSVKASVVSGTHASEYATASFTRGITAPTFSPQGQSFSDTIRISIAGGAGSTIHFTKDGKDPDATSPIYSASFKLDSSVEIKAIAFKSSQRSAIRSETYVLTPNPPTSKPAAGAYNDSVIVKLVTIPKARIYYTLDGTAPSLNNGIQYRDSILVTSDKTIKAVAIAGEGSYLRQSSVLLSQYTIITSSGNQTLTAGSFLNLAAGYQIKNLHPSLSALVALWPSDSVKSIPGFTNIPFTLNLQPASGTVMPNLQLVGPADSLSLYMRIPGTNQVRYLGPATSTPITVAGVYFLGTDIQSPIIKLSQESVLSSDSTKATFTINDNVINNTLNIFRSDTASYSLAINTPDVRNILLKNPTKIYRTLGIRIQATDGRNTSAFPAPPTYSYSLMQKIKSGVAKTTWQTGVSTVQPWDFVGFPILANSGMALKDLRDSNGNEFTKIQAVTYIDGLYHTLKTNDKLPTEAGFWLASDKPIRAISLPEFVTSAGDSNPLVLHPGWNSVSNHRFDTLFWPISHNITRYAQSKLKGLLAYDPLQDKYFATDSLLPWRGYWVYYSSATGDTAIKPRFNLPPTLKTTASNVSLSLSFHSSQGVPLQIGAHADYVDGFGVEDEPMIPTLSKGPWAGWLRGRRMMMTDQVAFRQGQAMEWNLVLSATNASGKSASLKPYPLAWHLPEGYEVWAVSKKRGLRFEINSATTTLQSPAGFSDTLQVYAASTEWIQSNLSGIPTTITGFKHNITRSHRGFDLNLQWPGEGRIRIEILNALGHRLADQTQILPEGHYRIPLSAPKSQGIMILHVTGKAGNQYLQWAQTLLGTVAVP